MKKKHILRSLTLIFVGVFLFAGTQAYAECTGVYVGPDASSDGTTILARSNDYPGTHPGYANVVPAVKGEPGRTMPVDMEGTVQEEIPENTYKYTETPLAAASGFGPAIDAACCTNECGVAMTMSVTAFSNDAAMKADPWEEHGISECTVNDLVICQSSTAREAVDLLLALMDKYGSSETNIAMIADQKEAWYVEMYTGHQYAAVKLPADQVSVFGNEFTLEYLSDYQESITSKDLENLAEENDFAVYGRGGEINLFETYSGDEMTVKYSHMRTWYGHQLMAPSRFGEDYDAHERYPLCFFPDSKVDVSDVRSIMKNRYEGTRYAPDQTGKIDIRVIGTETAMSTHIVQIWPDFAPEISCVTWYSCGPAVCGVFVPISNAARQVSESYHRNQPEEEAGNIDMENYPYYAFKSLATLCTTQENQTICGLPIQHFWNEAEEGMFAGMRTVLENAAGMKDKAQAEAYITAYCSSMQERAFADARQLNNDLMRKLSDDDDTMKMGRNPETHEVLDTERVLDPMEVQLDAAAYAEVPDVSETQTIKDSPAGRPHTAYLIMAILAVIELIAAAALVLTRRKTR